MSMRLSKYIAGSGVCSRRKAEELIRKGEVSVDGKIVMNPASNVEGRVNVRVNEYDRLNYQDKVRIWVFNKPAEVLVTNYDEKGRRTLFELLPRNMPRVITVGRLDYLTEGLILLTNNGDMARYLELPSSKIKRTYRVKVFGRLHKERLKKLMYGISIRGVRYSGVECFVEKESANNHWLIFTLEEGKNREIRTLVRNYLDLSIKRIIRIKYGKFNLRHMTKNGIQEVKPALVDQYIKLMQKSVSGKK